MAANDAALDEWLALAIGNSRLHWAWFAGTTLQQTWNTDYVLEARLPAEVLGRSLSAAPLLWLASVVPDQTELWQRYPHTHLISLADIPLQNQYPTLGIDRALALWGALEILGAPVLVIDAGTALTFTGADTEKKLVGGAITPGLALQLRSLAQDTAALPATNLQDLQVPSRWATDTSNAIKSGVFYTLVAGVQDFIEAWRSEFPNSAIALTGGDGDLLYRYLSEKVPAIAPQLHLDPTLVFRGMALIRNRRILGERG